MTCSLARSQSCIAGLLVASAGLTQTLFPIRQHDRWGYCDSLEQIVVAPTYSSASVFSRAHVATVSKDSLFGFIDTTGISLTPIQYDRWSYFWCDVTYVWKDGKVGIIDSKGRQVLPLKFDDVDFQCDGPIALKTAKGWQLYSATGKPLNKRAFESFLLSSNMLIGYQKDGLWGFMSKEGKLRTKARFEEFTGFSSNGLGAVRSDKKWGYVDVQGRLRIPMQYEEVHNFQDEGAWVRTGASWGLVDSLGRIKIHTTYERVSYFKEGLAFVKLNGKWGYVDRSGSVIIPFLYTHAFEFSEGLAEVCIGDTCGYIDHSGKTIVPLVYDLNYGGEFHEGLAEVRSHDDHYGFIDRQGEVVVPVKFDTPYDYNSFDDGIGQLLVPSEPGQDGDNIEARRFYFDRRGRIFLIP